LESWLVKNIFQAWRDSVAQKPNAARIGGRGALAASQQATALEVIDLRLQDLERASVEQTRALKHVVEVIESSQADSNAPQLDDHLQEIRSTFTQDCKVAMRSLIMEPEFQRTELRDLRHEVSALTDAVGRTSMDVKKDLTPMLSALRRLEVEMAVPTLAAVRNLKQETVVPMLAAINTLTEKVCLVLTSTATLTDEVSNPSAPLLAALSELKEEIRRDSTVPLLKAFDSLREEVCRETPTTVADACAGMEEICSQIARVAQALGKLKEDVCRDTVTPVLHALGTLKEEICRDASVPVLAAASG